jgi:hypothetical protein
MDCASAVSESHLISPTILHTLLEVRRTPAGCQHQTACLQHAVCWSANTMYVSSSAIDVNSRFARRGEVELSWLRDRGCVLSAWPGRCEVAG